MKVKRSNAARCDVICRLCGRKGAEPNVGRRHRAKVKNCFIRWRLKVTKNNNRISTEAEQNHKNKPGRKMGTKHYTGKTHSWGVGGGTDDKATKNREKLRA